MNTKVKIIKESTISFFGMGFGQFIRYLITTFIARFIGVELLGIYSISNAITRIMEIIGKVGLDEGVLKYVSSENDRYYKKQLIKSALKMGFIFSLIIMIFQIIIADWLTNEIFQAKEVLKMVIILQAISIPFYTLIHISSFSIQAYKLLKYKIFVYEILNPLLFLISVLSIYFFISSESAIIYPALISSIISLIAINFSLIKVVDIGIDSLLSGTFNKGLLKYSIPIMFITILGTILHWTDVLMLGYYSDVYGVGLYHPASRTAGIIRIVLLSFAGIYGPIMAEMFARNKINEINHLFKLVTRWITTFSIPLLVLILIYSKKIMLIFGSEYVNGHTTLLILSLATFVQAIFGISGVTLNMTGFARKNLINSFIGFTMNIILNILLIPIMGGLGAAIATLFTLMLIALIRVFQNWRLLNINPMSLALLKPIIAGLFTLLVLYLVKPIIMPLHTIFTLICAIFLTFSIFFLFLWCLKLDKDDMGLVNYFFSVKNN